MQCVNHPQQEATGACMYCGKMFCSECLVEADGKMYCKSDITKVLQEAKSSTTATAQPSINIVNNNTATATATASAGIAYVHRSKIVSLVLCFLFGYLGAHRFYVGKIGTGILWLLTLGLFGVGVFIDFILILIGAFKDNNGQPLR